MLAYVFWHRPREDVEGSDYESALIALHRSLAHRPPIGLRGSVACRVGELHWLPASEPNGSAAGGYEDWYLVDDYTALGVLAEAVVGRGHRTAHDAAAHRYGAGAAGLYALQEGDPDALRRARVAVWVARDPGSAEPALGLMLGDGADPACTCLWRRQLVLGPAPELCLLAPDTPAGAAPTRLPEGWHARTVARELLYGGPQP